MQLGCILEYRCSSDVPLHDSLELPGTSYLALLRSELLNVLLDLLAEEDLLQTDKCPVLERKLSVVEQLLKVCAQFCLLEVQQ